jgi:hypothetical protein
MALWKTMQLLKAGNEPHKRSRCQYICWIYIDAMFVAFVQLLWLLYFNVNDQDIFMTQEEQNDILYLVILVAIAYLWRPNPQQQMYGYALLNTGANNGVELPILDLELTESRY